MVSKFGKAAGVVVNKADGKYASAHDLRRSSGTRWAKRVMPAVLQRLMRHASIDTTMAYYVTMGADEVADDLWGKFGATEGEKVVAYNNPYNKAPCKQQETQTAPGDYSPEAVTLKEVT